MVTVKNLPVVADAATTVYAGVAGDAATNEVHRTVSAVVDAAGEAGLVAGDAATLEVHSPSVVDAATIIRWT